MPGAEIQDLGWGLAPPWAPGSAGQPRGTPVVLPPSPQPLPCATETGTPTVWVEEDAPPSSPRVGGGRPVSLLSFPAPGLCCPQQPAATALDPAALSSLRGAPWPPPPPGPAGRSAPIPWGAPGPLPTPGSE